MSAFGAVAGVAGGLLGSFLQSRGNQRVSAAEIAAAERNRDFDLRNLNVGAARQLALMVGPQEAERIIRGNFSKSDVDAIFRDGNTTRSRASWQTEMADIDRQLAPYETKQVSFRNKRGGGLGQEAFLKGGAYSKARAKKEGVDIDTLLQRRRELSGFLETNKDNKDGIDLDSFREGGPGLATQFDDLTTRAGREATDAVTRYDADTGRLIQGSRAIEGQARAFGRQERERIATDAARDLQGLNRATESRLMGRGLGSSTLLTGGFARNTRTVGENRENALGGLGDRQIGLLTGLAGNTLNLNASRAGARTGLVLSGQDRTSGFAQNALNFRANVYGGQAMNPWLARSTQQYFSPASPSGAADQTWGGFASGLGGLAAGGAFNQYFNQSQPGANQGPLQYNSGLTRGYSRTIAPGATSPYPG